MPWAMYNGSGTHGDHRAEMRRVISLVRVAAPDVFIKTYVSAFYVQPNRERAYAHSPPRELFRDDEVWTEVRPSGTRYGIRVDRPATRDKLVAWIVNDVRSRGYPLVHIDNLVPPWWYSPSWVTDRDVYWASQREVVRATVELLHRFGIRAEVNVTAAPGLETEEHLSQIAELGDGITLEMPWHRSVLRRPGAIEKQMRWYRSLLDRGRIVGWYVTPGYVGIEEQSAHLRMHAALAMCLREPGDHLWVGARFWRRVQDEAWSAWPQRAGRPLDPWALTEDGDVQRKFENGTVTARIADRDGEYHDR